MSNKHATVYENKRALIEDAISGKILDVGFWGQAVRMQSPDWPHAILKEVASEVYGVDLSYDGSLGNEHYQKAGAEDFDFPAERQFDFIFAGDLIEHLSNPGLFLDRCAAHLASGGKLVLTTPNCFSLYSLFDKLIHPEPSVNPDHTMYFNHSTLRKLLEKNGWRVVEALYIRTPDEKFSLSVKRRLLGLLDRFLSLWTPKWSETIAVVAEKI